VLLHHRKLIFQAYLPIAFSSSWRKTHKSDARAHKGQIFVLDFCFADVFGPLFVTFRCKFRIQHCVNNIAFNAARLNLCAGDRFSDFNLLSIGYRLRLPNLSCG
jgi:hypothetical protein